MNPFRDEWRNLAACKDQPTELFFPERGEPTAPAVAVCTRCKVQAECLVWAMQLETRTLPGVYGGLSERGRLRARPHWLKAGMIVRDCNVCKNQFPAGYKSNSVCSPACRQIMQARANVTRRQRYDEEVA